MAAAALPGRGLMVGTAVYRQSCLQGKGPPSFTSSSRGPTRSCRQLLPKTVTYTMEVFSSAPCWQTGETEITQCKQIWWKAEEIIHVSRITPAREEERSPISLSYLTLQSTVQQYYLLYDKRAFYSNMTWSSFAWKISSVFSKILLVPQRENGDYTSKPWASMPMAGAFIQCRTNTGDFLNCSKSDNYFSFLRMPFGARWAASRKTGTFTSFGFYPPNYLWRITTTFSTVQKQLARQLTVWISKLTTILLS